MKHKRTESTTLETRSIFNPHAIERYAKRQQQTVLPRFVSPPVFAGLWVLLILLGIGLGLAWGTKVPIFASGTAVVTQKPQTDELILVAFLAPTYAGKIETEQPLLLKLERQTRLALPITSAEPTIINPETARQRFNLSLGTAMAVTQPSIIVTAAFQLESDTLDANHYQGSIYQVDIQIGSRRVTSLLPIISHFTEQR